MPEECRGCDLGWLCTGKICWRKCREDAERGRGRGEA
jgi:hypothetical protein